MSNCSSNLQVTVCRGADPPTLPAPEAAVIAPVNVGVGANPTLRVKVDVVALKPGVAGELMVTTQPPSAPAVKKKLF